MNTSISNTVVKTKVTVNIILKNLLSNLKKTENMWRTITPATKFCHGKINMAKKTVASFFENLLSPLH